jgi:hypothetical protein
MGLLSIIIAMILTAKAGSSPKEAEDLHLVLIRKSCSISNLRDVCQSLYLSFKTLISWAFHSVNKGLFSLS